MKKVLAQLSKLRYELQTDKPMESIGSGGDLKAWQIVFSRYREKFEGENPKWFAVSWLFAECFMYRKIVEILRARYYIIIIIATRDIISSFSSEALFNIW